MRLRTLISSSLALAVIITGPAAASATGLGSADAPADPQVAKTGELTLLATTDVHGNVLNWDYFANRPYPAGEELGMSRASTLIKGVREDKGAESVLLVDNGDTIQGNPLAYYFAKQEPITTSNQTHPLAKTYNHLGFDAQVVGNHEFNYGLDLLATYSDQVDFPLLGANVIDDADGQTHLDPYTMVDKQVGGETITVGVLGVTTPGSRIWDKNNLSGKVHFDDPVETAEKYVPKMKQKGADVIVVLSHSGKDPKGQSWDPDQLQENVSTSVAKVSGIDVLVAGHTHQNEPSQVVNRDDGSQVLITQPNYWARSVSEVGLPINLDTHHVDWGENEPHADALATQGKVAEDQEIKDLVEEQHRTTIDYVNTKIGSVTETMSAKTSYYEDTAILDFISHVQTETVEESLKGTDYEDLAVISQASPFSRTAEFPAGDITIRDVAGLYVYDNTLAGVEINGAQLRDYLEYSARYFKQTEEGAEFDPVDGTNATDEVSEAPIPDYNYDALAGIDYDINVSKPSGERIENLKQADGRKIGDDDRFLLAINNYRQSGGGGYPVDGLKEVYNEQVEVRQALIDWAEEKQIVDPADFFDQNWQVVTSSRAPGGDHGSNDNEDADNSGEATAEADSNGSDGDESDAGGTSDAAASGSAGDSDGEDKSGEATAEDEASTNGASDSGESDGEADGGDADYSAAGAGGGVDLPRTGLEVATSIGIAAAIIALGTALVVFSRRRRR
ncbi:2',3'-cyclic-nucleotide 2'-phosphodiesterase / 3'-nucleotidase [Brevibacterium siliguriense]|uniref:2',3'-cyclic-nucleotide 2'-phosphodiesterase / 3'-nucleotidase n=1 Tax=Brevibacterium siliguriense TaxID=1136497 RepID=A0A1H1VH15_9MICO|nr:5'-nucleotidase C-terminal domain-containing protein [Brevibacterium siliguriense]SDS83860.1 2',3'-cyclic-nucleotide 2'-phosphodiesterase / 3'-nucleotidase [Brevibacterium siliguriense]